MVSVFPGDGRLHKAVTLGSRVHIIEELQVFPHGQPVQNLLLDSHRVSGPQNELGTKPALPSLPKRDGKFKEPRLMAVKRVWGRTCQRLPGLAVVSI